MTLDSTAEMLSEHLADAIETAAPALVAVHARRRLPGTGTIWSSDESGTVIVTASHIVEREEGIAVRLPDRSFVPATLRGRDLYRDLAVLHIERNSLAAVSARSRPLRVGNLVVAVGRPWATNVQASLGSVTSIDSVISKRATSDQLIHSSVTMLPGFSGGPLVDPVGQIAGISTSGLVWKGGVTIPVDQIERITADIVEFGYVRCAWIGVTVQTVDLPEGLRDEIGDQETGILVSGIADSSPAAAKGLLVGDILVSLDGHPLTAPEDLQQVLHSNLIDTAHDLTIIRGGALMTIEVVPGERPGSGDRS